MYQKVLFPTDFSPHSQRIIRNIREIPGISEVVLLHVAEPEGSPDTGPGGGTPVDQARDLLAGYQKILEGQGLTVTVRLVETGKTIIQGNIGSQVQKTAERENVSMIVMGARGKSLRDLMLGSVSTWVLHHTTFPLLLIKSTPGDDAAVTGPVPSPVPVFSKVLLPTDFSGPAGDVIRFVKESSGIEEIILLHVIDEEKDKPGLSGYVDSATKKIGAIGDELGKSGIPVRTFVSVGYPPDEINDVAAREHATLIALSPTGAGWVRQLRELFVGSTTYAVVRRATCPVLVVRPPRDTT